MISLLLLVSVVHAEALVLRVSDDAGLIDVSLTGQVSTPGGSVPVQLNDAGRPPDVTPGDGTWCISALLPDRGAVSVDLVSEGGRRWIGSFPFPPGEQPSLDLLAREDGVLVISELTGPGPRSDYGRSQAAGGRSRPWVAWLLAAVGWGLAASLWTRGKGR